MNRTIFLRELRTGLLQELVAVGTLLGLAAAAGWLTVSVFGQPFRDMREALSTILFLMIALLAFSSGARTFTAESRRRQELFFAILPISRRALWLSMVGGRLAAAVPMAALLFLADFLLGGEQFALRSLGATGGLAYAVLFASGCCFSLLFRRDPAAYLAGALIVPPVVSQSLAFTTSGFSYGFLRELLSIGSASLIAAAFSLLSWFFFQRGEIQVRSRQLINLMLLGVTLALVLLLIGIVAQSPLLDRFAGPWTQDQTPLNPPPEWQTSTVRRVSPGGRYLAVVEALSRRPEISRVTIVETATGRRLGEQRWRNLGWVSWDGRKEVLRILCSDSAFPLFWRIDGDPVTAWIRLAPDGQELTRSRFWGLSTAVALRDGSDLLLDQKGETSRLILLDEHGHTPVLVTMPRPSRWSFQPMRQGILVTTEKSWQVADGAARELRADEREALLQSMASREAELRRKARLLASGSSAEDPLLELRAIAVQEDVALYLPAAGSEGRAALYDATLDREVRLPSCDRGQSAAPWLTPTPSSPALLVRFECRLDATSGPQTIRSRHFFYLPGSGSAEPLPDLDPIMDNRSIRLAYLDNRTAIWRPQKGETWQILRDGQIRTLWPPQPPID